MRGLQKLNLFNCLIFFRDAGRNTGGEWLSSPPAGANQRLGASIEHRVCASRTFAFQHCCSLLHGFLSLVVWSGYSFGVLYLNLSLLFITIDSEVCVNSNARAFHLSKQRTFVPASPPWALKVGLFDLVGLYIINDCFLQSRTPWPS